MTFETPFSGQNFVTNVTNIHIHSFVSFNVVLLKSIQSCGTLYYIHIDYLKEKYFRWLDDGSYQIRTQSDSEHVARVRRLETAAMRKWLARRRWARACHIIRATIRMRSFGDGETSSDLLPEYLSSEVEVWIWVLTMNLHIKSDLQNYHQNIDWKPSKQCKLTINTIVCKVFYKLYI